MRAHEQAVGSGRGARGGVGRGRNRGKVAVLVYSGKRDKDSGNTVQDLLATKQSRLDGRKAYRHCPGLGWLMDKLAGHRNYKTMCSGLGLG